MGILERTDIQVGVSAVNDQAADVKQQINAVSRVPANCKFYKTLSGEKNPQIVAMHQNDSIEIACFVTYMTVCSGCFLFLNNTKSKFNKSLCLKASLTLEQTSATSGDIHNSWCVSLGSRHIGGYVCVS